MLDIALLLDQHFSPAVWDCLACTLSVVLLQGVVDKVLHTYAVCIYARNPKKNL